MKIRYEEVREGSVYFITRPSIWRSSYYIYPEVVNHYVMVVSTFFSRRGGTVVQDKTSINYNSTKYYCLGALCLLLLVPCGVL